jgi:hypothetical protein
MHRLSKQGWAAEIPAGATHNASHNFSTLKGSTMRKLLGLIVLLMPMLALGQQSGIDGTWKIDLNKAKLDAKPMVYELKDGYFTCSTCDPKIHVKADGTDQKITGSPYVTTESITVLNPNSVQRVGKKDGQVRFKDTLTISDDGMAATQSYEGHPESGQTVNWTGSYSRVGEMAKGASPITGEWKVDNYSGASSNVLTFVYASKPDGMEFKATTGESYTAKFDGKEYPFSGDPGTTSVVLKKIDDHTFEEIYKRGAEVTGMAQLTVSPDGKSLTMVMEDKRRGTKDTWVAEKEGAGEAMADK